MSFDINPMGPAMHLKEIERTARQQQMFDKAAPANETKGERPASIIKDWALRLVQTLAIPRTAA